MTVYFSWSPYSRVFDIWFIAFGYSVRINRASYRDSDSPWRPAVQVDGSMPRSPFVRIRRIVKAEPA